MVMGGLEVGERGFGGVGKGKGGLMLGKQI